MPQLKLHTLGVVSLDGPHGAVSLDEPRLVALVVSLAIAGDGGVSDDELLLRLTPNATAENGRVELARLVAVARLRLGSESSIVRTATGYAFTAGLIALDVQVLSEPAATECGEFLAGFKLPGSPEFGGWLVETRRRVEPLGVPADACDDVGMSPVPARKRFMQRLMLVGVAAVVVAGGLYLAAPRSASGFSTGDPLLLSDIKNETGDSVFDAGMMSAAAIALQQSGRLQLYQRSRLPAVYRLMQITNRDTALTFELAKEVAQRDGVRFVLGLQIDRVGDGYRVTGRLVDVSTPDAVTTTTAMARSKNDVLTALDEVLLTMRRRLGETRRDMEDRRVPLPFVTTASLEALRSYGDGSVAWSRGNYRLANELWHRAVDIDTGFAMAYGALGLSYYYNHNRDEGERYFAEAFKRVNRMTERERLRLMENAFEYRGQTDSANAYSGLLAKRYPGTITWANYGTSLMKAGRDSEASLALHTALSYDPKYASAYINLATSARHAHQTDTALAYYARAGQLDSVILYRGNINHEWGGTLVRAGRYAEAESAFSKMTRAPTLENRALGFRSLGYLALWRGSPDQAIEHYRQAVAATVQSKSTLSEARNRLLLSMAYRTSGRDTEASDEVTKTMAMINSPYVEPAFLAMVATNCIKLGRIADVQTVLKVLRVKLKPDNKVDRASEAYVAGLLALSAHHPDSALHYARASTDWPVTVLRLTLESEAFRALGRADSARVAVARIIAFPGFGVEGQDDWLHAPLVMGDLLLAVRDTAGAMKEYQRLLDQWRSAPPGLTDVTAARARLASLRANVLDRPRD